MSPGGGVIGTVIPRSSRERERERETAERERDRDRDRDSTQRERECVRFERERKTKDGIIFFLVCTEWLQEEEHWVREG
jgi:hypothetical protein